jgi:flagellar biosynthesis protein
VKPGVPATPPPDPHDPHRRQAAVALKGAGVDRPNAPARLVAKGHGAVAEQILQLAFARDVRVREDADLVEVLEAIDLDAEVPLHALAAVAEILSYVYRANGLMAGGAPDVSQETDR